MTPNRWNWSHSSEFSRPSEAMEKNGRFAIPGKNLANCFCDLKGCEISTILQQDCREPSLPAFARLTRVSAIPTIPVQFFALDFHRIRTKYPHL